MTTAGVTVNSGNRIAAVIGEDRKHMLERLADENDRSLSAELRRAIDLHLGISENTRNENGRKDGST